MTELERARAHLRECQSDLVWARKWHPNTVPKYETAVLAALSWVWQEQEREKAGKLINDYGVPWIREALGAFP